MNTITITTPDTLKMVREALCAAQAHLPNASYRSILNEMINGIDLRRPLGPDGKSIPLDLDSLPGRRAVFVYEGAMRAAVAARAPIVPEPWLDRDEDFRRQFVEIVDRQCGPSRSGSPAELHGGWVQSYIDMGWRYGPIRDPEKKTHPDMVPYASLDQAEQDKDAIFIALCEIARQWIRDNDVSDSGTSL